MDLKSILAPFPLDDFLTSYLNKQILRVEGSPQKFAELISWRDVLGLAREWSAVPATPEHLAHALRAGATIDVERAQGVSQALDDLLLRVGRQLAAPVAFRVRAGCAAHAETPVPQDLLILQIEGQRLWSIQSREAWSGLLHSGDALYFPRGSSYSASAAAEPTLELFLAIDNPTGVELMRWLVGILQDRPSLTAAVPRFEGPGEQSAFLTQLRRDIAAALRAPNLLAEFTRALDDQAPLPRPPAPSGEAGGQLILTTPRALRVRRASEDQIYIVAAGERLHFPLEAAPFLHFIGQHHELPVTRFYEEFETTCDREDLRDFLGVLARHRIVEFRP